MSFQDVLIVGSGFGGAVLAARIGEHATRWGGAVKVQVLEQGDDPTGLFDQRSNGPPLNPEGNRFRHTLSPSETSRWVDLYTDPEATFRDRAPSMNVAVGRGLGGGSNVYSGVSIRAPSLVFEQTDEQGRRLWPSIYSRASLDPYYQRVESTLRVAQLAWTDAGVPQWQLAAKRDLVFAEGCRRIGATALPLKVATQNDRNEGWWSSGQRFEGRQSLTKNYLAAALSSGVTFRTGSTAVTIAPIPGGYVVRGIDRRQGREEPFEIECRALFLAAGAIASSALLLRSEHEFGARALDSGVQTGSPRLGRHLSGNGDYGVSGVVGESFGLAVEGQKGKPISSYCPSFFREHQFLVLPFYAEPLYLGLGRISTLLRPERPDAYGRGVASPAPGERDWGLAHKQRLETFCSRTLTMGCLALDKGEGEIHLDARGEAKVRWWQTHPETEARWSKAVEVMQRIYRALGGEMYLDTYRKDGTVNTSHPLGGCRMAERDQASLGIVDPNGESFMNPDLFVVDGAIVPSALCANPSLTIAAVAESIAERLLNGVGTRSLAERLGR